MYYFCLCVLHVFSVFGGKQLCLINYITKEGHEYIYNNRYIQKYTN